MLKTAKEKNAVRGVNLISMRMRGHSGHSGYDRLADYLLAKHITPPPRFSLMDRLIARCFKVLIDRSGSIWYHRSQFLCEIKAARQWMLSKQEIFHFIYGENSYQYLAKLKKIKPGNRIVCTYHTPPDKFKTIVKNTSVLHDIDAAIVVSSFQKDFFINLLGHHNVWFVPHGIDLDYFRPASKIKSDTGILNCLFVGSHLRDIEAFKQVVEILEHNDQHVMFHIVSKPENTLPFKKYSNVRLYSKISDQELLNLYQSADLLTLPLIDSTANNTILEAMACGLPIITTDLPGTRDYLSDDCALFVSPGDAVGMVENIQQLKDNRYRQKLSVNSRQHARQFDWNIIADTLMNCYRQIL